METKRHKSKKVNHGTYTTEAKKMIKQWREYLKANQELRVAVKILDKISKKKYKALIVGGGVRDIILGGKPKDIDIATNAPIEELEKMFKIYDIGKSRDFGIVVINVSGLSFEISQFRADGRYIDGRRPEKVSFNVSLETDLGRRDLTINSMAIDKDGNLIDHFDGRKDIKNKIIKTVGDPRQRFSEDYLRLMRAARFSSKLGFKLDKDTESAMKDLSINIKDLALERIKEELIKAAKFSGDKFADYILTLDKTRLLKYILPEVFKLKSFKENPRHHPETVKYGGTVFSHTVEALKKVKADKPIAMLATLFHDIGKAESFSQVGGLPKYLQHVKKSVDLVNIIADRLKMSNQERNSIGFAVANHMKFHEILKMRPSKIAKLVKDDNWDILTTVAMADEFSRGETFIHAGAFEKIVDKAVKVKNKVDSKEMEKRLKLVDGFHVMKLTNLTPGKAIGKIIRTVTAEIIDKDIKDKKEIDDLIIATAKEVAWNI